MCMSCRRKVQLHTRSPTFPPGSKPQMWYFRPVVAKNSRITQQEDKSGHSRAHVCHPRLRLWWQFTRVLDWTTVFIIVRRTVKIQNSASCWILSIKDTTIWSKNNHCYAYRQHSKSRVLWDSHYPKLDESSLHSYIIIMICSFYINKDFIDKKSNSPLDHGFD